MCRQLSSAPDHSLSFYLSAISGFEFKFLLELWKPLGIALRVRYWRAINAIVAISFNDPIKEKNGIKNMSWLSAESSPILHSAWNVNLYGSNKHLGVFKQLLIGYNKI